MQEDEQALEFRFAVFFDFLGASNAALTWPRERVHEFVDLLISIATIQSSEDISGEAQADGSYRLLVTPEVTTFSDNIVVSYSGEAQEDHPKLLESMWTEIVCKDANRILAGVAEMGLRIGLLLRGGMAFGELYHQSDVVFGEALVNAYSLEKTAQVPRVVVSDAIINKLTHVRPQDMAALAQDADGKWHLNYIAEMEHQAQRPGPMAAELSNQWRRAHLERINAEIVGLRSSSEADASRRAEKWEWFKQRFETLRGESQSPFRPDDLCGV
jgi:hypothetical protein